MRVHRSTGAHDRDRGAEDDSRPSQADNPKEDEHAKNDGAGADPSRGLFFDAVDPRITILERTP
jgi:hypothetical protein